MTQEDSKVTVSIRQLHPHFVGEVEGIDLRQPLAAADVNAIDKNGCTPLCAALLYNAFVEQDIIFQENRAKIQAFLKSEGGNAGNTPVNDFNIFEAIGNEDILLVNKYLKEPINLEALFIPEGFPFAGASTLHLAIIVGNEDIVISLLENREHERDCQQYYNQIHQFFRK